MISVFHLRRAVSGNSLKIRSAPPDAAGTCRGCPAYRGRSHSHM